MEKKATSIKVNESELGLNKLFFILYIKIYITIPKANYVYIVGIKYIKYMVYVYKCVHGKCMYIKTKLKSS